MLLGGWGRHEWRQQWEVHDVVVMTPDVLLHVLHHAFLKVGPAGTCHLPPPEHNISALYRLSPVPAHPVTSHCHIAQLRDGICSRACAYACAACVVRTDHAMPWPCLPPPRSCQTLACWC